MLDILGLGGKPARAAVPDFQGMRVLDGRVAVVTGSSSGIGAAIARAMAGAGAKTVVSSPDEKACSAVVDGITRAGGEAWCVPCDVSDEAQVKSLVESAARHYGSVDIMVNNAGIYENNSVLDTDTAQWRRILAVDLDGVFFGTKYAALNMKGRGWGRIINISSIAGLRGFQSRAAYCAAKSGVIGLTRAAAADLGEYGITVNAICPGVIKSRMTEAFIKNRNALGSFIRTMTIKRVGLPEDIAHATLFLASEGSGYITGEALSIDGGWNSHLQ